MKKHFAAMLGVAMLGAVLHADAQQTWKSLEIGASIPEANTKMMNVDGREVSLNDIKSKAGLLVMFSCNTCPYVIKSQARTKEIMAYAQERSLGMAVINSNEAYRNGEDAPDAMKQYYKEQGYTAPYLIDVESRVANAFGATRTPEVFLFDNKGSLIYKGAMEDQPADPGSSKEMYLKNAIKNMAAGVKPNPNATKSIGCSIKRL